MTEFWKLRHTCIPIGMCAPGDTPQAKVDKLLGDIEFIKKIIDSILVSSEEIFHKNIEQLTIIFIILRAEGLKVNYLKCTFGLKDITYL